MTEAPSNRRRISSKRQKWSQVRFLRLAKKMQIKSPTQTLAQSLVGKAILFNVCDNRARGVELAFKPEQIEHFGSSDGSAIAT